MSDPGGRPTGRNPKKGSRQLVSNSVRPSVLAEKRSHAAFRGRAPSPRRDQTACETLALPSPPSARLPVGEESLIERWRKGAAPRRTPCLIPRSSRSPSGMAMPRPRGLTRCPVRLLPAPGLGLSWPPPTYGFPQEPRGWTLPWAGPKLDNGPTPARRAPPLDEPPQGFSRMPHGALEEGPLGSALGSMPNPRAGGAAAGSGGSTLQGSITYLRPASGRKRRAT